MTGTRAVIAAAGVALVLGVAACSSDDPEPRIAPTPSGSVETSSTAPPVGLNPLETVSAWVDARNDALNTGDLAAVMALTSADCKSCKGILEPIAQVYARGGKFQTSGWRIVASRIKKRTSSSATVPAGLEFRGGKTIPSAGADPVVYDSEKHIVVFKLRQTAGGWRVMFVGFLS